MNADRYAVGCQTRYDVGIDSGHPVIVAVITPTPDTRHCQHTKHLSLSLSLSLYVCVCVCISMRVFVSLCVLVIGERNRTRSATYRVSHRGRRAYRFISGTEHSHNAGCTIVLPCSFP